jgi:hypothetical protein
VHLWRGEKIKKLKERKKLLPRALMFTSKHETLIQIIVLPKKYGVFFRLFKFYLISTDLLIVRSFYKEGKVGFM